MFLLFRFFLLLLCKIKLQQLFSKDLVKISLNNPTYVSGALAPMLS